MINGEMVGTLQLTKRPPGPPNSMGPYYSKGTIRINVVYPVMFPLLHSVLVVKTPPTILKGPGRETHRIYTSHVLKVGGGERGREYGEALLY
jgi:hypothetical protein